MRLGAALLGDLRQVVQEEIKDMQANIVDGLREGGQGCLSELRQHVAGADLGRLARAWAMRIYKNAGALDATALLFVKGRSARAAMASFEYGAIVRPVKGRYLAIPTQFNRAGGRKGGKVLYRPKDLTDSFVIRSNDGSLLLMARVQHAQTKSKGRIADKAYVNSRLLGSGRKKRTAALLQYGAVPMFVLMPSVRITKRLDIAAIANKWADETARIILRKMG